MPESKANLLVVEDEPSLLQGIRDILELDGYAVETAKNGKDALDKLGESSHIPDLIISDIMMPYMNGFEFLQHIRKEMKWVDIPFIFLTAKDTKEDKRLGLKLGVDVYITKPFDSEVLLSQVANRIERGMQVKQKYEDITRSIKNSLTSMFNHEVRTPTMIISGFADLIKDNLATMDDMSPDEMMLFLREITHAAERLRRLMDNFITYAEIESGEAKRSYDWRKQPISEYDSIVQMAYANVMDRTRDVYNVEINMGKSLPTIMGDVEYLTAIIRELLSNAVKFSKPTNPFNSEPIRVKLDRYDDRLRIQVQDPGRGIPEEEHEKIWQPYYQINRQVNEDQGAGAGLAIVKNLVEMHGGIVFIERTEIGIGSTFTVLIPTIA